MRIRVLGGLRVEHDGAPVHVVGAMQQSVLFRLAIDVGRSVSYREIIEDCWGLDAPENERAALQSVISRLRAQLPPRAIESTQGGYRLTLTRGEVDALAFDDAARAAAAASPSAAAALASAALELWQGEPWTPSDEFDWFVRDLRQDAERMRALARDVPAVAPRPSTVPAPLTPIVGRLDDLAGLRDRLATNRLVTIIGTGGAGKTRLAVEAARAHPTALFVELAPVAPQEVLTAVLTATGRELLTAELGTEPAGIRRRVLDALGGREVLLVLDNCEHLVDQAAAVAADLLGALPALRVLTTSREPLGVPGEAFVVLGALAYPGELVSTPTASDADPLAYPAVELFRQRALAARGRELDAAEFAVAGRICAALDGLPLAIELAAAKLRTMGTDEVLTGLEHRFTLLSGGFRAALPRHQTLRAMIDWSWDLLGEAERAALTGIAVYPAGIAVADAEQVGARPETERGPAPAEALDALVDRSLLQRIRGRYRALETIREYGIQRLAEAGGLAAARSAQAERMAAAAATYDAAMRGPAVTRSLDWFDAEEDNLAAALRYSVAAGDGRTAVTLAASCIWYWIVRDREEDAETWLGAVAPLASEVDSAEARMIELVWPVAQLFRAGGPGAVPDDDLLARGAEMLAPVDRLDPAEGATDLLQLLPVMLAALGRAMRDAGAGWMGAVQLPRGEDLGLRPWPTAALHVFAAAAAQNLGDLDLLGSESSIALEQFERQGDLWGIGIAQQFRSEWLALRERLDEALELSDRSLATIRRVTPSWDLAQMQGLGISLLVRMGRIPEAEERARTGLAAAERSGNGRASMAAGLNAVGVDLEAGRIDDAERRLDSIDEHEGEWPTLPPQLRAILLSLRARIALRRGALDVAEDLLRQALVTALATHDHPIIGAVVTAIGGYALRRGDLRSALRAIDLVAAITGAHTPSVPQIAAIERAAADAGIGRDGTFVPSRPKALELLATVAADPALGTQTLRR